MQQLFVDTRQQAEQGCDPPEGTQGVYDCSNLLQALPGLQSITRKEDTKKNKTEPLELKNITPKI